MADQESEESEEWKLGSSDSGGEAKPSSPRGPSVPRKRWAVLRRLREKKDKLKKGLLKSDAVVLAREELAYQEARIKFRIKKARDKVSRRLDLPETIRLVDRVSFVCGILLLLGIQFAVIVIPEMAPRAYAVVFGLLMAVRYLTYHAQKMHYFMLDFCYFMNVALVYFILFDSSNLALFKILFSLTNGPILSAIILWQNSLVFHDWDKITSMYIHIPPTIVTFLYKYTPGSPLYDAIQREEAAKAGGTPPFLSKQVLWSFMFMPMVYYLFWQVAYLVWTQLYLKAKFQRDPSLVTSLKWLTELRPHPFYKWAQKRGYKGSANSFMVACQVIYTIVCLLPMKLFWDHKMLQIGWIGISFLYALWAGASYYFEVFSKIYVQRLEREERQKRKGRGTYATSLSSFFEFAFALGLFCAATYALLVLTA